MDKLLLSPDYSNSNCDRIIEVKKVGPEVVPIKTHTPLLNPLPSPTKELTEFLHFHNRPTEDTLQRTVTADQEWALLSNSSLNSAQYETPNGAALPAPTDSGNLESEITPQLLNVVASANLHCKLDLRRIAIYAPNVEYNPRRLSVLYLRIRKPAALALIFSNGKLICTGSTSVQISRQAVRKIARIIQKIGFPVKLANYKILNLIAFCNVPFHIRLELVELIMHTHCIYEPELFPGLIYRAGRSRVQMLIFSSGRIVVSGSKQYTEIQKAFREIYPILMCFEKKFSTN